MFDASKTSKEIIIFIIAQESKNNTEVINKVHAVA